MAVFDIAGRTYGGTNVFRYDSTGKFVTVSNNGGVFRFTFTGFSVACQVGGGEIPDCSEGRHLYRWACDPSIDFVIQGRKRKRAIREQHLMKLSRIKARSERLLCALAGR